MPAFRTGYETEAEQDPYDIRESDDGIISFIAGKDIYPSAVEDFEEATATTADAQGLKGVFCEWDLASATVGETSDTQGNGSQAVILKRNGTLTSSVLQKAVRTLSFKVWSGKSKIIVSLSAYINGQWKPVADINGNEQLSIARNSDETLLSYKPTIPAGSQLRITMLSTTSTAVAYIDDMSITFYNESTGISSIAADEVRATHVYNLSGQRVDDHYHGIVISNGRKQFIRK